MDGKQTVGREIRRVNSSNSDGMVVSVRQTMPVHPLAPAVNQRVAAASLAVAEADVRPVMTHKKLDMHLPGAAELLREAPKFHRSRWWKIRTWALRGVVAVLILSIGTGGWLFGQGYFRLHQAFAGGAHAVALQKHVTPQLLRGEGDGRINILLLGNGGDGHQAPDLTDSIMLASIDPVNHTAALVSVPRDMWVSLPGHGSMKINAAYETGKYAYLHRIDSSNADTEAVKAGFITADEAVEQVLGININYNLLVNFISFRDVVNILGGVTVNVPETLYDPTMAWENHWNPVLAQKGIQTFDGQQALVYVRSRETSSDFARSERQRAVITAIKDKLITLGTLSNPLKLSQLMSSFGNNVKTDLSLSDAYRVYTLTKGISDSSIVSSGLGDNNSLVTTGRVGNQSVVLPKAGVNAYDDIQAYLRKLLPDGYIVKEHASVEVLAATADAAAAAGAHLSGYGYNVVNTGVTPTTLGGTKTELYDRTRGRDPYTLNYLQNRFGVKVTATTPKAVQQDHADFIIVIR
jgi:LCP family protein required for cell wall assembly